MSSGSGGSSSRGSSGGVSYGAPSMGNYSMSSLGGYSAISGLLAMYIQEQVQKYIQEAIITLGMYGGIGSVGNTYNMQSTNYKGSIDSKVSTKSSGLEKIAGSGGSTPYISSKK